jgi:hypothetical protein
MTFFKRNFFVVEKLTGVDKKLDGKRTFVILKETKPK